MSEMQVPCGSAGAAERKGQDRGSAGRTSLADVDTQAAQLLGDRELLRRVQRGARRLQRKSKPPR